MDAKRLAIGSATGAVMFNVVGYLVWGMLLADFFAAHSGSATGVDREAPIWWAVIVSTLLLGAFLTMVLDWSGSSSAADGFKTGAISGLLLVGGWDFLFYGFMNLLDMTGMLVDIALGTVQWGLAGLAIAAVLGMVGGGKTA